MGIGYLLKKYPFLENGVEDNIMAILQMTKLSKKEQKTDWKNYWKNSD